MTILKTVAIPLASYPDQTRALPATPIPDWVTEFRFELFRCTSIDPTIWPLATTSLKMDFEASFDGGATWLYAGGNTAVGGVASFHNAEIATHVLTVPLPPVAGRQIRGTVVIAGGPLRTQGTLTFADAAG